MSLFDVLVIEGVSESDYPLLYGGTIMHYFNRRGGRTRCRVFYNEVDHCLYIKGAMPLGCSPLLKQKTQKCKAKCKVDLHFFFNLRF